MNCERPPRYPAMPAQCVPRVASVSRCRAAGRRWGAGAIAALQIAVGHGTKHQTKGQGARPVFMPSRVGAPLMASHIMDDVAALMVRFGCAFVCIFVSAKGPESSAHTPPIGTSTPTGREGNSTPAKTPAAGMGESPFPVPVSVRCPVDRTSTDYPGQICSRFSSHWEHTGYAQSPCLCGVPGVPGVPTPNVDTPKRKPGRAAQKLPVGWVFEPVRRAWRGGGRWAPHQGIFRPNQQA